MNNASSLALDKDYFKPRNVEKQLCKTVAQDHLAALWRRLQILQESLDTIDIECFNSFSKSEHGSTTECGVDIINQILATVNACNASSSQSPRDE